MLCSSFSFFFFFFNDTATTEIYTLSLHDALPIRRLCHKPPHTDQLSQETNHPARSEEHTSELQSRSDLVCRLLLEKKKKHNHSLLVSRHPKPTTNHIVYYGSV